MLTGRDAGKNSKNLDVQYDKSIFYLFVLFYLYIYPPDSQESDGGANT